MLISRVESDLSKARLASEPQQKVGSSNKQPHYIPRSVRCSKRLIDMSLSLIGIALLLPVIPVIAAAIKLDSSGPVLYRQVRLGQIKLTSGNSEKSSKPMMPEFTIYKFRSMYIDAEHDGVARLASINDPRITRVGAVLRKTRLDEIPQLVNVLLGQMSLIGPRPERPELSKQLDKRMTFFSERTHGVLPGLTGLAQINQSYAGSVDNIDEKLAYDHAYSAMLNRPLNWLYTDLTILWRTVLTVIKCNG